MIVLSRREMLNWMVNNGRFGVNMVFDEIVFAGVVAHAHIQTCACGNETARLENTLRNFVVVLKRYYNQSHRSMARFEQRHAPWLDSNLELPRCLPCQEHDLAAMDIDGAAAADPIPAAAIANPGVQWDQLSRWTRWRRTTPIIQRHITNELGDALARRLTNRGNRDLGKAVSGLIRGEGPPDYSPARALRLMVECELSVNQYKILRDDMNVYPSYDRVLQERKALTPEGIQANEHSVRVPVQNLLDMTVRRLISLIADSVSASGTTRVELIAKWGLDGSTNHSDYKIRPLIPEGMENEEEDANADPEIQMEFDKMMNASFVPLCLVNREDRSQVVAALLHVGSHQTCPICLATPNMMNRPAILDQRQENPAALIYGISSLHAWIRAVEHVLHLAYRIDLQMWRIPAGNHPSRVALNERKRQIQRDLRLRFGVIADQPLPSGKGNTNDGNLSRRLFSNPAIFSEVTGVDVGFIQRIRVLCVHRDSYKNQHGCVLLYNLCESYNTV
ncbi:unnamed protein product [Cyprideis torosa]|uniref:Uncharacterized protein n=1 Tax=Cyprideis torosa TaxID=163714 RepID=A0A7R8ZQU3_9CRUS|nr:unnamed protein product [Cyprideis torosa]CAG0903756.1 unnamed protein product [Cyprideis torosa]